MMPYIQTPWGKLYTYAAMVAVGVLVMLSTLHIILKKSIAPEAEEDFVFPKIVVAGILGFAFSGLFDSLFKIRENRGLTISGITFYGGLIGAVCTLYFLLKVFSGKTEYSIRQWFDILTVPFILFHSCGRVGCFLGGCCYGKTTDCCIGVVFPANADLGIIAEGTRRYPTQLFEVAALFMILAIVLKVRKKFETYLICYAIMRFIIEFFRGDNRGYIVGSVSPAQIISISIVICIVLLETIRSQKSNS